jgi:hypothetical protein
MSVTASTEFLGDIDVSVSTEWESGIDNYSYGIRFRKSSNGTYGLGISAGGRYILSLNNS